MIVIHEAWNDHDLGLLTVSKFGVEQIHVG